MPGAQARLEPGGRRRLVACKAHGEGGAEHPHDREADAPGDAQRARRDAGEDDLDDDRADRVAGERGAVVREGAADVVAQQQGAVDGDVAARSRCARARIGGDGRRAARRAQCIGRESHGATAPWLDIWLTARTACVRELTPSARSTAATWSLTVSTERSSSRAISLLE